MEQSKENHITDSTHRIEVIIESINVVLTELEPLDIYSDMRGAVAIIIENNLKGCKMLLKNLIKEGYL
ncbi:MAG: hypothetical protein ACYDCP_11005 [Thermoplasmataceae archaeon]